jgi:hypothetical protein
LTDPEFLEPSKKTLIELLSSSEILHAVLFLDGVYTPIEDASLSPNWTKGREIYFKIEGKIERHG